MLVANRKNGNTLDAMFQIAAYLDSQGIGHEEMDVTDLPDAAFPYSVSASADVPKGPVDLIITLGGDGTILQASRYLAGTGVPVLGVNMGNKGFLAELEKGELDTVEWLPADRIILPEIAEKWPEAE